MDQKAFSQSISAQVANGQDVSVDDLMQALAAGPVEDRRVANIDLANAYLKVGKTAEALSSAERAWFLGHRADDLLRFLVGGLIGAGRQKEALDRLREGAIHAVHSGNAATACDITVRFHVLASSLGLPIHDSILTAEMVGMLARNRQPPRPRRGSPLRIGYLFWGEEHEYSVLPPMLIEIARYHDRSKFNPLFFSCHPRDALLAQNATFASWLSAIEEIGGAFVGGTGAAGPYEAALMVAENIRRSEIDVLVPLGQVGINFFVAALRPASLHIGLDVGGPHGYSSPALDHVIVTLGGCRYTMEEHCDATQVYGAYTAFSGDDPAPVDRATLGLESDEIVVMTCGLASKFKHVAFLRMLGEVAAECRDSKVRVVLVGPDWGDAVGTYLRDTVAADILPRIVLTGYRKDFPSVVRAADIYLDTYPVGGGWSFYEALSAGIATVAFGEDLRGLFNKQQHLCPASVHCAGTGIVVPGDDVSHMKRRILDLIADPELRRTLGARGRNAVKALLDKQTFTRDIESAIERVYFQ